MDPKELDEALDQEARRMMVEAREEMRAWDDETLRLFVALIQGEVKRRRDAQERERGSGGLVKGQQ